MQHKCKGIILQHLNVNDCCDRHSHRLERQQTYWGEIFITSPQIEMSDRNLLASFARRRSDLLQLFSFKYSDNWD